MRALTLHQPFAHLVATGAKTVETRSWKTGYRGPLAIHAAKSTNGLSGYSTWDNVGELTPGWWQTYMHPSEGGPYWLDGPGFRAPIGGGIHAFGEVVAVCDLVDVVPMVSERNLSQPIRGRGEREPIIAVADPALHGVLVTWLSWVNTVSPGRYIDKDRSEWLRAQMPFGDFAAGRYAWVLDNVRPLARGFFCKGRQGLWTLPDEVLAA